jgi:F-type H+-transporting ATPase subunit b
MMFLKFFFFQAMAFAEETHHAAEGMAHDPHAIPWSSLFVQTFNFICIFVFLYFVLRKAVKAHFEHRARDYKMMVDRADSARREAEANKRSISDRLQKLESSAESSLADAKAEAEILRARMISEAKELSTRLEADAKRTTQTELERAKAELRRELLQSALKSSNENLQKSLGSSEQKQLQNEFVEKIQVVGG